MEEKSEDGGLDWSRVRAVEILEVRTLMNRAAGNEYAPDLVSAPGKTLAEILEEQEITPAELAERTGRPKRFINEVIAGKGAITQDTAIQLERALGVSATFWNSRERYYREFRARQAEGGG